MKDRLKKIRKDVGLSQTDFAESIGLSRIFISQVETGTNKLSDRSIRDICRTYNVNEEWFRNGSGEPYLPLTKNQQIANFFNDVLEADSDDFKKELILGLSSLDIEDWRDLARLFRKIMDSKEE